MSKTRKTRNESSSNDAVLETEIPPHACEHGPVLEELEPLEEALDSSRRIEKIRQAYAQVCLHMSRATLWVTRLVELSVYPALTKKGQVFEPVVLSPEQVEIILNHVRKISASAESSGKEAPAAKPSPGRGASGEGKGGSSK